MLPGKTLTHIAKGEEEREERFYVERRRRM